MVNVSLIVSSPEISLAIEVQGLGEIYGRTLVSSPLLFPQQTSALPLPFHIRLQETSGPAIFYPVITQGSLQPSGI